MVAINKTHDVQNADMLIPKLYLYHYVPITELDQIMKDKGIKKKELKIYFTRIPNNQKYGNFLTNHMLVRINPPKLKKSKSTKFELIGINPVNNKEIKLTLDEIKKLSANNKYFYKKFETENLEDVPYGIIKLEDEFLPAFTYKIYLPVTEHVQLDGIKDVLMETYTLMDLPSDLKTLVNDLMIKNKINKIIVDKYNKAFNDPTKINGLKNKKVLNELIKMSARISKENSIPIAVSSVIIALDDKTNPKSELIDVIDNVPSTDSNKIKLFILQRIFNDKKLISREQFKSIIGYLIGKL